jgi:hypothetical protein
VRGAWAKRRGSHTLIDFRSVSKADDAYSDGRENKSSFRKRNDARRGLHTTISRNVKAELQDFDVQECIKAEKNQVVLR